MKRYAISKLIEWKNRKKHKPLILQGARQVGKTWLMKEFGKTEFKKVIYINFEKDKDVAEFFSKDLNVKRIIRDLEIKFEYNIVAEDTLIILDEIQECSKALTALKYFYEDVPQYNIICAGSLLGIYLHSGVSFPVGKVEILYIYPLSFYEFLDALGQEKLCNVIKEQDYSLLSSFENKINELLKYYFYIGGMPEVVNDYAETKNILNVRKIQKQIISNYERDFSKHVPKITFPKLKLLWENIPNQLAKEHKKFVYNYIKEGARAREYENAMAWLKDCGLIYKVNAISKPAMPLKAYENISNFKLLVCDIGLLSALTKLSVQILLKNTSIFTEFKGALTEQYVLQQLKTLNNEDMDIFYWANENSTSEVDFIIQTDDNIIPLEAKAGLNLKAKSLKFYREQFKPEISIRTSLANYKKTDDLYDIPLYAIEMLNKVIKEQKKK
ncbi:ATP-binding protein [Candidatus Ruminimicrobium bovinum]|uniref:ATP-binding protein n=1 Tax=Candidatus Ruminimicrobium bovinum TaxID=3242779 RepID=UPI0039B8477E